MNDELLTIQQAADLLGVSTKTLRRWEAKGFLIPQRTVGNQRRYSKTELSTLLQKEKGKVTFQLSTPVDDATGNNAIASEEGEEEQGVPKEPVVNKSGTPVFVPQPVEIPNQSPFYFKTVQFSGAIVGMVLFLVVTLLVLGSEQIGRFFTDGLQLLTAPAHKGQAVIKQSVLAASDRTPAFQLQVNVPGFFGKKVSFLDSADVKKSLSVAGLSQLNGGVNTNNADINAGKGKLTASNVIYSIQAGSNVTITGDKQNPTISATGGVTSLQGQNGAVSLTNGTGISLNGLQITNTGVLSVGGTTGDVTLTGGSGISVSGTTISNTDGGSAQDIFKTITAGGTDITASSNTDQITFAAGSGIDITGDANNKTITITNPSAPSSLTTNGVLYATGSNAFTSLMPGSSGFVLQSNGPNSPPSWVANSSTSPPFSIITSGTNTQASMVVGTGASLDFTGTGTINASSLNGNTFANPGSIGSGTAGTGAFTTLSASNLISANGGLTVASGQTFKLAGLTVPGGVLYTDNTGTVTQATLGSDGQVLELVGGVPTWQTSAATNFWQFNAGVIAPASITNDLAIGGVGTSSALFQISGTTGNASTSGVFTFGGTTAQVQAENARTLILGGNNTGNVVITSAGNIALTAQGKALTTGGDLSVNGNVAATGTTGFSASGDNAGLTFSGLNNHIISASAGTLELGALKLTGAITGNGENITGLGTINGLAITADTGVITTGTWNGTAIAPQYGGTGIDTHLSTGVPYIASGTWNVDSNALAAVRGGTGQTGYAIGDLLYADSTTTLAKRAIGTNGQILTVSGGLPVWSNAGGTLNFWQETLGSLSPFNVTDDLLLGSTATGSAKFAFTNVAGGVPTASISAGSGNNAAYLSGDGTLGTTNKQSLTLGSLSTGNIILNGFGAGVIHSDAAGVLSSAKVALSSEVSGILPVANGGTGADLTAGGLNAQGSIPYFNNSNVLTTLAPGTAGRILETQGPGANPVWIDASSVGTNYWQENLGAVAPLHITDDLLLGASATTSADFAFTGLSTSTPVASFSAVANGGNKNGISFDVSNSTIQALNKKSLTLGGSSTGNIVLSNSAIASAGLTVASGQNLTLAGITGNNQILFATSGSGQVAGVAATGVGNQCLLSSAGGTPVWGSCVSGNTSWVESNGTIYPGNATEDLLIGGSATSSAKFALTGVNTNTPVASLSGATGGTYLTAAGNLATTNRLTLALGGGNTGNITLQDSRLSSPVLLTQTATAFDAGLGTTGIIDAINKAFEAAGGGGGAGGVWTLNSNVIYPTTQANQLGIGITSPTSAISSLYVTRDEVGSGALGKSLAIFNQPENQDILTASASGATRFVVNNNGNLQFTGGTNFLNTITSLATANQTITVPILSGSDTLCFHDLGNCAGTGGGVTQSGSNTSGQIAYFTSGNNITSNANFLWNNALSVSGANGGAAAAIINQQNSGDIFSASASGLAKFTIAHDGTISDAKYAGGSNAVVYATSTNGTFATITTGSNSQCLLSGPSGPTWGACDQGNSSWIEANGTIYPGNATEDLLIGGTATSSAKFAFINVAGTNTPTASISGANNNALSINATGTIQTSNAQSLLLNPNGLGNVGIGTAAPTSKLTVYGTAEVGGVSGVSGLQIDANDHSGNRFIIYSAGGGLDFYGTTAEVGALSGGLGQLSLGVNNNVPAAQLDVLSSNFTLPGAYIHGSTGVASLVVNQTAATDIFTASASGVAKFTITNVGNIIAPNYAGTNAVLYATANGTFTTATTGLANQCLLSGGSNPAWGACDSGNTSWVQANGTIYPGNATEDLLLGGTSTASAKFAFINVAGSNTPTASISATGVGTGLSLAANGTIQSLQNQTLTIGGTTTGNISLAPLNGVAGSYVAPNTDNLVNLGTASLRFKTIYAGADVIVNGQSVCLANGTNCQAGTVNYWDSSNGVLTPKIETQDLLLGGTATASADFAFTGVDSTNPTASISAFTNGGNKNGIALSATNATIQSLNMNTLTLGGTSTGDIAFRPGGQAAGNSLYLASSGNVGIGTTSPITALDVAGTIGASGVLNVRTQMFSVSCSSCLNFGALEAVSTGGFSGDRPLKLQVTGGSNATVGIGIIGTGSSVDPLATLDVRGVNATLPIASFSGTTTNASVIVDQSGSGDIFTASASGLPLFKIDKAGNVGVGAIAAATPNITSVLTAAAGGNPSQGLEIAPGNNQAATLGLLTSGNQAAAIEFGANGTYTGGASIVFNEKSNDLGLWTGAGAIPRLDILSNGTIGIGTQNPLAELDVRGNVATTPVASFSGATTNAGVIVDQSGTGSIFTASKSGATKFTITNSGNLQLNNYTTANGVLYTDSAGNVLQTAGTNGQCLMVSGGALGWNTCAAGTNFWQENAGALAPAHITDDLLLGGTSTASARFAFTNNTGSGAPTASISGNLSLVVPTGANPAATINILNGGSLNFKTSVGGDAGLGASALYIANSGKVGINTNNPDAFNGHLVIKSGTGDYGWTHTDGSISMSSWVGTARGLTGGFIGMDSANPLVLYAGGTSNMAFLTNGDTNIGQDNAGNLNVNSATLQVRGTGASNAIFKVTDTTGADFDVLTVGDEGATTLRSRTNTSTAFQLQNAAGSSLFTLGTTATSPVATIAANTTFAASVIDQAGSGDLFTASTSGATKFVITNAGNVGIGTANPASALTVNGKIETFGAVGGVMLDARDNSGNYFGLYSATGDLEFYSNNGGIHGDMLSSGRFGLGLNNTSPVAQLDVRGDSGTLAVASISGNTSLASLFVDNAGSGDLFTASKSGATKFAILNNGNIQANNYTANNGLLYTNGSGVFQQLAAGTANQCLEMNGSATALTWVACAQGTNYWQENAGALAPSHITDDLLLGGTSTASARFAFINTIGSGTPTASISANNGANATYLTGAGVLGTTNKQSLVLGSATTGNILFTPGGNLVASISADNNGTFTLGNLNRANNLFTVSNDDSNLRFPRTLFQGGQSGSDTNWLMRFADAYSNSTNNIAAGFELSTNNDPSFTNAHSLLAEILNNKAEIFTVDNSGNDGQPIEFSTSASLAQASLYLDSVANGYQVGIGTTAPSAQLDVEGQVGTNPVGYFNGNTAKAALMVNNTGSGDLFTASKSGATKFVVTNAGNVGIGTSTPSAKLEIVGPDQSSTTNTFNVYDAARNPLIQVKDDGEVGLGEAPATFGYTSSGNYTGSSYWNGTQDLLQAQSFTTTAGGTVKSMSTYIGSAVDATHNSYQFGIYSDSSGVPGTLLAQSSVGTLTAGAWNTLPISYTLSASTKYWLVYWSNVQDGSNNSQNFLKNYSGSNKFYQSFAAWGGGTMPGTFPSGTGPSGGFETSIYASFTNPISALALDSNGNLTENGNATFQPAVDSTNAFQINNTTGTQILGVDTTIGRMEFGCGSISVYTMELCGNELLNGTSANELLVTDSSNRQIFNIDSSVANVGKFTFGNITSAAGFAVSGNLVLADGTTDNFSGTIATTTLTGNRTYTLPDASGTICVSGSTCATSGTVGYFQRNAGALSPANLTDDLLLGGTSTTSAKFAFTNVAGNTPTASISGSTGATSLTANGILGTTNAQTLTLGSAFTGDIAFRPGGQPVGNSLYLASNGNVGIGIAAPGVGLDVWTAERIATTTTQALKVQDTFGNVAFDADTQNRRIGIGTASPATTLDVRATSGTLAVASISGATSFAGMVVDNSGAGDIFTASSSGMSRFTIQNNGNVIVSNQKPSAFAQLGALNVLPATAGTRGLVVQGASGQTADLFDLYSGAGAFVSGYDATGNEYLTGTLNMTGTSGGFIQSAANKNLVLNSSSGTFVGIGTTNATNFGDAELAVNQQNAGGDIFTASQAGNTKFVITNAGNVGIGTNNPLTALEVNAGNIEQGGVKIDGSNQDVSLQINNSAAGGVNWFMDSSSGGFYSPGNLTLYQQSGNPAFTLATPVNMGGSGYGAAINLPTSVYPNATFDIRAGNGRLAIASVSGATSFAGMVVDNSGSGDLFTASKSGATKFTVRNNGQVAIGAINTNGTLSNSSVYKLLVNGGANTDTRQGVVAGNAGIFSGTDGTIARIYGYDYGASAALPLALDEFGGGIITGVTNINPLASLDVRATSGTLAIASVSGKTSFAGLVVDNSGVGDLFTASKSGATKFVITNAGNVGIGTTTPGASLQVAGTGAAFTGTLASETPTAGVWAGIFAGTDRLILGASGTPVYEMDNFTSTGSFRIFRPNQTPDFIDTQGFIGINNTAQGNDSLVVNQPNAAGDIFSASQSGTPEFTITHAGGIKLGTNEGTSGQCITSGGAGAAVTWGTCGGSGSTTNYWQLNGTTISQANTTEDLVLGGTATASAKFAFIGNAGNATPVASISAQGGSSAPNGLVLSPGSVQSLNKNTLTLGGSTTGNININPSNNLTVQSNNNSANAFEVMNLASDPVLNINTTTSNLISNPSFETGFAGWSANGSSTVSQTTAAGNYYYGSGGLQVALAASGTSGTQTSSFTSTPGTNTYTVSFWAKGSAAIGGLAVNLGSGTCTLNSSNVTTSWAYYYCTATTTGSIATLTITSTTNSQTLYLDGVQLVQTSTIQPYQGGLTSLTGGLVVNSNSVLTQVANQPFAEQINSYDDSSTTGGGGLVIYGTNDNIFQNALVVADTIGQTDFQVNTSAGEAIVTGGSNFFATPAMNVVSRANLSQALVVNGASGALVSTASVSAQSTFAAMVVDNSGTGDLFTASKSGATKFTIKNSGTVVIGNTTNGIVFDPTFSTTCGGVVSVFCGSARPTKQITLTAEYPGVILSASPSAGLNTNGFMTSDASYSATPTSFNHETYYQWTTTQSSQQSYNIGLTITLPKDFSDWPASGTVMSIDFNTGLTTSADNALDVYLYQKGDTSGVPVAFRTNQTSGTAKNWTTVNFTRADFEGAKKWDASNPTSQQVTLYLGLKAKNNTANYVQVGDIKINYLSAF